MDHHGLVFDSHPELPACKDCGDPVESLNSYHAGCCGHDDVIDIEAAPFRLLVGTCTECGSTVTADVDDDGRLFWEPLDLH